MLYGAEMPNQNSNWPVIGGIAAALRMRARGYNVTLIERLDAIGGRAQVFENHTGATGG